MRSSTKTTLALVLGFVFAAGAAQAGPCDAYYKFDGNLSDSSGGGNDGMMVTEGGEPSTPDFVEGRFGQGLQFSGKKAMRAFVDLSYEICPKMTFTAWIKTTPAGSQTVLGVANRQYIMTSNKSYYIRSAGKDLAAHDAVLQNMGWMFIAATWDAETRKVTLHWRNRTLEGDMGTASYSTSSAFWLGALNDAIAHSADNMVLDEVRLIGEVMSHDQILAMRDRTGPILVDGAVPTTTSGPSLVSPPSVVDGTGAGAIGSPVAGGGTMPDEIIACTSHEGCSDGSYCGWDRVCHPDSHAPMQDSVGIPLTPTPIPLAPLEPEPESEGESAPEPSSPSGKPRPIGEPSYTGVAGFAGDTQRSLDFGSSFLTHIWWDESSDRPCEFTIKGWGPHEHDEGTAYETTRVGSSCPAGGSGHYVQLDRDTESAIGRIEVCNNTNSRKRLKGIRIWGSRINDDGSKTYMPTGDSRFLPNCDTWSSSQMCGVDKVATGIVLHATQIGSDRAQVTGLQLICRAVGLN